MPYLYFVIHCLLTIDYLLLMRGMRSSECGMDLFFL